MRRDERGRKGEQVKRNEEELVHEAKDEQDSLRVWASVFRHLAVGCFVSKAYLVRVVKVQEPALALVDILVARVGAANNERGIHVHVVAGKVEGNETLEDNGPSGERGRQEDEQARGGAAVGNHVEDGAEAGRLLKDAGGLAIEGVEKARDAVEERARTGVQRHVVEGCKGEDDADVACEVVVRYISLGTNDCKQKLMAKTNR